MLSLVAYGHCQCGCGRPVTRPGNRYLRGHCKSVTPACPLTLAERKHANYMANRQERTASAQAWAEKNREKRREISKAYYERNRAEILVKGSLRAKKNRAAINARMRRWKRANREKVAEWNRIHRKRDPWKDTLRAELCAYCGAPASEVDHIEPLARGGVDDWTNFTAACGACNRKKSTRSMLRFLLDEAVA